jgi:hypothetical protein
MVYGDGMTAYRGVVWVGEGAVLNRVEGNKIFGDITKLSALNREFSIDPLTILPRTRRRTIHYCTLLCRRMFPLQLLWREQRG